MTETINALEIFETEIRRLAVQFGVEDRIGTCTRNGRLSRALARTKVRGLRPIDFDIAPRTYSYHPYAVIEIARHEFAHALEWINEMNTGHGPGWKRYARIVGAVPKAGVTEGERIAATKQTETPAPAPKAKPAPKPRPVAKPAPAPTVYGWCKAAGCPGFKGDFPGGICPNCR